MWIEDGNRDVTYYYKYYYDQFDCKRYSNIYIMPVGIHFYICFDVGNNKMREKLLSFYRVNNSNIPKFFYSLDKTCSNCENINEDLQLRDREWTCKICKVKHNRDYNASINILREGLRERTVGASTVKISDIRPDENQAIRDNLRISRL